MGVNKILGQVYSDLLALYGEANAMELAAIWLKSKVKVGRDNEEPGYRTVRITAGDLIVFEDGELKQQGDFTHKIVGCFGDIYSTYLSIMVKSLDDEIDIQVIKLK